MLEFDSIVVEERPLEGARRRPEPMAMKFDEGDHVALGIAWLSVLNRWHNTLWPRQGGGRAVKPLSLDPAAGAASRSTGTSRRW